MAAMAAILEIVRRMDSSPFTLRSGPFPIKGMSVFLLLPCFIEVPVFNASSLNPDQTPRSAASDLSLHCLPLSRCVMVHCEFNGPYY